jgi:hypothetical protein
MFDSAVRAIKWTFRLDSYMYRRRTVVIDCCDDNAAEVSTGSY